MTYHISKFLYTSFPAHPLQPLHSAANQTLPTSKEAFLMCSSMSVLQPANILVSKVGVNELGRFYHLENRPRLVWKKII